MDSSSDPLTDPTLLSEPLLAWYALNARRLPWRDEPTPYRVWVSEIMLQQTRVETVIPYFLRWMDRFPTIAALAQAPQQDVLHAWEGLGYYSRARNLHKAAQIVQQSMDGNLPNDADGLIRLPGIGRYTAGAIASIAFGKDSPALDGNIRRILARVFNVALDARSPQGERLLWQLARETLPSGHAGDFNQALMDLGSQICIPRAPLCLICPLAGLCQARALGVQEERPVLAAKPITPHYEVTAAIMRRDESVLIARRPANGLLGGLWEFPGGKQEAGETLPECLTREIQEELGVVIEVGEAFGVYEHAFTHFRITLHAFFCQIRAGEPQALHAEALQWVETPGLLDYPMGKVDRLISKRLISETREAS